MSTMRTNLDTRYTEDGDLVVFLGDDDLTPYGLKVNGPYAWVRFLTGGNLAGYFEAYGGIAGGVTEKLVDDLRTALGLPTPKHDI